jgi:predicted permease
VGRQQKSRADTVSTIVNTVDVDYFETAGATIDSGRPFTSIDQDKTLPVAIVNEKIAHDFWPGQNPLGKQIRLPDEKQSRQVVGVARIANYTTWGEAPQPCVYVPLTQKFSGAMTLFVRTRQDPRGILAPVRQQLHQAAPRVFSNDVRTGQEIVEGGLFQARVGVALLSVFGLLALGLASIGLYGILGYSVSQRQREIGVRIALGAKRTAVLQLILRNGMTLVIIGLLIGFAGALAVTRLLSRLLYGVSAADPLSLVSAAAVLLGVALLACYLPARRASGIDPLAALREG